VAKILVLHGPNLNLLGSREPHIYGHLTLVDINNQLAAQAQAAGHELAWFQSNAEHELVGRIQQARDDGTALILFNPAAFTHTSA
jgi:3-dehydroquinate dehydratase-2